jgi:hypothetical protein
VGGSRGRRQHRGGNCSWGEHGSERPDWAGCGGRARGRCERGGGRRDRWGSGRRGGSHRGRGSALSGSVAPPPEHPTTAKAKAAATFRSQIFVRLEAHLRAAPASL